MTPLIRISVLMLIVAVSCQWWALGERLSNGYNYWWKIGKFWVDGSAEMLLAFVAYSLVFSLLGVVTVRKIPPALTYWALLARASTCAAIAGGVLWPVLLLSPFGTIRGW